MPLFEALATTSETLLASSLLARWPVFRVFCKWEEPGSSLECWIVISLMEMQAGKQLDLLVAPE